MVRDLNPGVGSSQAWTKPHPYSISCPEYGAINAAIAVGPSLLFTGDDGARGRELWVSDGTNEGTRLLSDLTAGPGGSSPDSFTRVGSKVVFRATDADGKVSLWAVQAQPYQQFLPMVRR